MNKIVKVPVARRAWLVKALLELLPTDRRPDGSGCYKQCWIVTLGGRKWALKRPIHRRPKAGQLWYYGDKMQAGVDELATSMDAAPAGRRQYIVPYVAWWVDEANTTMWMVQPAYDSKPDESEWCDGDRHDFEARSGLGDMHYGNIGNWRSTIRAIDFSFPDQDATRITGELDWSRPCNMAVTRPLSPAQKRMREQDDSLFAALAAGDGLHAAIVNAQNQMDRIAGVRADMVIHDELVHVRDNPPAFDNGLKAWLDAIPGFVQDEAAQLDNLRGIQDNAHQVRELVALKHRANGAPDMVALHNMQMGRPNQRKRWV